MSKRLKLIGKIVELLPVKEGVSKNGPWEKQQLILKPPAEIQEQNICFSIWGKNIEKLDLKEGNKAKVFFDVYSFKRRDKWYTESKAWKVENLKNYVILGKDSESNYKNFNINGKIQELTDIQTGKRNNKNWRRRQMVIETLGFFEKQVSFNIWNDNIDRIQPDAGEEINVVFTMASQMYNGSWYTHLNVVNIGASNSNIVSIDDIIASQT